MTAAWECDRNTDSATSGERRRDCGDSPRMRVAADHRGKRPGTGISPDNEGRASDCAAAPVDRPQPDTRSGPRVPERHRDNPCTAGGCRLRMWSTESQSQEGPRSGAYWGGDGADTAKGRAIRAATGWKSARPGSARPAQRRGCRGSPDGEGTGAWKGCDGVPPEIGDPPRTPWHGTCDRGKPPGQGNAGRARRRTRGE